MSGVGDDSPEMTERIFSDERAEALLRGRGPTGDDLAAFFKAAKATAQVAPDEATQARHLAAIREAASHIGSAPSTRSDGMVARIFRPRWAKIAAAAAAAVFATGGLAAADELPDPVQDVVEAVVQIVGIDVPDPDDDDAAVTGDNEDGDGPKATKTKRGMDHDGDGVADDNGLHRGQNKTGMDHDGDGVPDDNGRHTGQNKPDDGTETPVDEPKDKTKTGLDHDGDGAADDNGQRGGPDQTDDTDDEPGNRGGRSDENRPGDDDSPGNSERGRSDNKN